MSSTVKPWQDPEELGRLLQVMNDRQIAERFGVSQRLIGIWRNRHGLERHSPAPPVYQDRECLAALLTANNDTQIARQFGVAPIVIRTWRNRHGLAPASLPRPDYQDPTILSELLRTMNDGQIAERFGIHVRSVCYWRRRHGLAPSAVPNPGSTKYATDRGFFSQIDTPEKAYTLGFIIADGAVHKDGKSVAIAVSESDSAILRAIADAMTCSAPLHTKTSVGGFGGRPLAVLNLCGRRLVQDLAKLGVRNDKSHTATYPTIPPRLESHLIRGLFDGDGYIGPRQFALVGTSGIADGVWEAIKRHTGHSLNRTVRNGTYFYVIGMRRHREVLAWMYTEATISLKRKEEAFHQFWPLRKYWSRASVQSL